MMLLQADFHSTQNSSEKFRAESKWPEAACCCIGGYSIVRHSYPSPPPPRARPPGPSAPEASRGC
eukprot:9097851-Alexandrium_andersonii.AAC.1